MYLKCFFWSPPPTRSPEKPGLPPRTSFPPPDYSIARAHAAGLELFEVLAGEHHRCSETVAGQITALWSICPIHTGSQADLERIPERPISASGRGASERALLQARCPGVGVAKVVVLTALWPIFPIHTGSQGDLERIPERSISASGCLPG